ncbi:aldolase/citrate lyase family protein [Clostridioides difficile]
MSHLDYVKNANNEILKMMLIEQKAGYDNIEEIAQVKGVDIIALGSGDLSLDMGFSGYMNRIEIKDMISQAAKACKKYNMPFIIFPSIEKKSIETWIQ